MPWLSENSHGQSRLFALSNRTTQPEVQGAMIVDSDGRLHPTVSLIWQLQKVEISHYQLTKTSIEIDYLGFQRQTLKVIPFRAGMCSVNYLHSLE